MRDRDFEDEWEDIGRYLEGTGWAVKEELHKTVFEEAGEEWVYRGRNSPASDRYHALTVYGYPFWSRRDRFSVWLDFPSVRDPSRRGRQEDVFLAALSDLFDYVEAMHSGAKSPIEIRFPTISSLPMVDGLLVEGTWSSKNCSFRAPSAEDVIGIVEAFVLALMELRDA